MTENKFYITTAIPYVNAAPHIGFALEIVQTDVIARYHQLIGDDTYFLTGTDENSLKNVQAAKEAGVSTKQLVDENAEKFRKLKEALNLSFNDFIRTTEPRHIKGAQKLWLACKKEDIYKKKYKGLYCIGCEVFYTEKELVGGLCPEHKTKPQIVEEENYFFRLSHYQDWLEKLIQSNELKIVPETRKNEVLSFIRQGLEDFSISRSSERSDGWGVPVPGDKSQIMYVWFDALSNYITALGYAENGELYRKYWLENPNRVHIIGKGITRFHAIYWPAMLKSAGIPLPTTEFVHGYVTVDGQKISKSLGNIIDPFYLVEKYGTDAVRYYLLREIPAYRDGDFSESRFKEVYNADLANGLGNLVARVAKLCESSELEFETTEQKLKRPVERYLQKYDFSKALNYIWGLDVKWGIKWLDQLINEKRPWGIEDKEGLKLLLALFVLNIRGIAYNLKLFLPETAQKIEEQFAGPKIKASKPLFPRLK